LFDEQTLRSNHEGVNVNEGHKPNFPVNKPHSVRRPVLFTEEQATILDAWTKANGYASFGDAVRELIRRGLEK
jgi:hypothetical protein